MFKNLKVDDPKLYVVFSDGVILPATCNLSVGALVPIPILPFAKILNNEEPDEDATMKGSDALIPCTKRVPVAVKFPPKYPLPTTVKALLGVLDPIPSQPFASKTESLVPELFKNSKRFFVPCPCPA